jgi:hypothetical protein
MLLKLSTLRLQFPHYLLRVRLEYAFLLPNNFKV